MAPERRLLLDVAAGAEDAPRAGEDHDTHRVVVDRDVPGSDKVVGDLAADGVQALGPVQRDGGDVAIHLVLHELQLICHDGLPSWSPAH